MTLRVNDLTIAAVDPKAQSEFWMRALRWSLLHGTRDKVLIAPTAARPLPHNVLAVMFERTDEPKPEAMTNRLFFDLEPSDLEAEVRRLEDLGATRLKREGSQPGSLMMADPEGNEFCVLPPR